MIPGLDVDPETSERIAAAFATWAAHFRRNLNELGVPWLLDQYSELVRSVETQTCDHGSGQNTGAEWRMCCGISYEYMNDLAVRDALEVIIRVAGASGAERLASEVAPLDDRLYSLYAHRPERRGQWWRQGLPNGVVD